MVHPRSQLIVHTHAASAQLPGVFDGDADSVHDLRVATRRIREVLPLAGAWRGMTMGDLRKTLRRAGRALGDVRQLDTDLQLLAALESRVPASGRAIGLLRGALVERRNVAARRMVKRLERLELPRVLASLAAQAPSLPRVSGVLHGAGRWRRDLQGRVVRRAEALDETIDHATGLYLPNRLHCVRIAAKKLRYVLETADAAGLANRSGGLREVRRMQRLLGDLNDRHALAAELVAHGAADDLELAVVGGVVGSECRTLHEQYLERRDDVVKACAALLRGPRPSRVKQVVSIGALAGVGCAALAFAPSPPRWVSATPLRAEQHVDRPKKHATR